MENKVSTNVPYYNGSKTNGNVYKINRRDNINANKYSNYLYVLNNNEELKNNIYTLSLKETIRKAIKIK